jgi:hypothetical protein
MLFYRDQKQKARHQGYETRLWKQRKLETPKPKAAFLPIISKQ